MFYKFLWQCKLRFLFFTAIPKILSFAIAVMLLAYIQEVSSSNVSWDTNISQDSCGFPQSPHANIRTIP
jgi:hypothetical protein